MKKLIVGIGAACLALSGLAAEIIVDKNGGEGASFTTLQDAVNAETTQDGDTILVRPGVYDEGYATVEWTNDEDGQTYFFTNRVIVTKKLYFKSTDGAANTVIKGAWDTTSAQARAGCGYGAIRCVYVDDAGMGTVFEGFTFEDGAAQLSYMADGKTPFSDIFGNYAGGIASSGGNTGAAYAVDCVFHHCTGGRAGALKGGTAIRCRFKANVNAMGVSCCRSGKLLNCLFEDNSGNLISYSTIVNCTIANNSNDSNNSGQLQANCKLYNTVVSDNHGSLFTSSYAYTSLTPANCSCLPDNYCYHDSEGHYVQVFEPDATTVTNAPPYQFMSTLYGDYRLRKGTIAGEMAGDAAYIAAQVSVSGAAADIELYRDFAGNEIPKTGAINIGCYQGTVASVGGGVQFGRRAIAADSDYRMELATANNERPYAFFADWPHTFKVLPSEPSNRVYYWQVANKLLPPELDDSFWCVTPPEGQMITNTYAYVTLSRYVDGASMSEEEPDGSAEKPWKTIQDAFDAMDESSDYSNKSVCLVVAEGEYATGGVMSENGNSRVVINRKVRVVGAGRGKSFIYGARGADADGRGEGAYRCVLFSSSGNYGIIQGFTLQDGYSTGNETSDAHANSGGCVLGTSIPNHQIVDCELKNGVAFRGCAFKSATAVRCVIHDMKPMGGALGRPAAFESTLVYGIKEGANYIFDANGSANVVWNSTFHTISTSIGENTGTSPQVNNIYASGSSYSQWSPNSEGVLFDCRIASEPEDLGTNKKGKAWFVDAANGDFRLLALSDALTGGACVDGYWLHVQSDCLGNPRMYFADGRQLPGAVQAVLNPVKVEEVAGVTTEPAAGWHGVEPGETFTLTATPDDPNRCIPNFEVNGTAVAAGSGNTWTFQSPDEWDTTGVTVKPVLLTDWYVSPDGDDANNGWTRETPRQTLAGAMLYAKAGDTVHALAGTYNLGDTNASFYASSCGVRSRVDVPANVTLVSEEGPEKTIIEGAASPEPLKEGMGDGAIRCASIADGGWLEGFTLTKGCSGYLGSGNDSNDYFAGGALGNSYDGSKVVNCIIKGNVACRGGGIACVSAINCRILSNNATATSFASYRSKLYGCFLDYTGRSGESARFTYAVENCTILYSSGACYFNDAQFDAIRNTVFYSDADKKFSASNNSEKPKPMTNCVFVAGKVSEVIDQGNIVVASNDDIKLDANGHLLKGSAAIDAADAAIASDLIGDKDAAGGQRVYNGTMDVGAFEYDWRGDYAAKICSGDTAVAQADPQVVQGDGGVLIRDGSVTLALPEAAEGRDTRRATLTAQVTGNGILSVCVDGEVIETVEASAMPVVLKLGHRLDTARAVTLTYAKAEGDTDETGAWLTGFAYKTLGTAVMLR